MHTTIYLIRHSEPDKNDINGLNTKESISVINKKMPLSTRGKQMAYQLSLNGEFANLDFVYSSSYVRAISTAKYFCDINNLTLQIDERFDERLHGVDSWSELPNQFEEIQFFNGNYKVGFGESRKEVQARLSDALMELLGKYQGKTGAIIFHSTAIAFLLMKFSDVQYDGDYTFDNKVYFNGKWDYLETFKLEFNTDNELVNITNIKVD